MSTATTRGAPHRIVVGLGFGDEAKGACVDHLCATARERGEPVSAVVRFSGGAQAAHNVVVTDGCGATVHHTFRQFGSGTLAGVGTYLARPTLISPEALAAEADELAELGVPDPLGLVTVSPDALVVTPVHRAVNRTREDLRGEGRHGSCGLGIGEAQAYALEHEALRVRDCLSPTTVRERLMALMAHYAPLLEGSRHTVPSVREMAIDLLEFAHAVAIEPDVAYLRRAAARGPLVFEGSQGVLLDEWRGFHPHTTWSTTTPLLGQVLLADAGLDRAEVWGAVRAYATRHGAGPFPTESADVLIAEPHNEFGTYQGAWRTGHLDLVLLDYAARVCRAHGGLDRLAISHLDAVERTGVVRRYRDTVALPLGGFRDLAHQEALTALLFAAEPVVDPVPVTDSGATSSERSSALAALISRTAGAALGCVAYGPARGDRMAAQRLTP